ncbi:MAG: methionine adenosyltransferase [Candidatus Marinimicrobia bacterium]|jgi:S-adenosylmethionine synthetase|nr:methionine adenosyltransferase [Candidatus Neomarinimicrobiota bacterium]MDP6275648.1 methionine adenosyltransferase [Candidatus Neomarinimicrobiota bacterium]MDP7217757.1 methionine adenosyltransferase [Candidatus Neomarinimicrobiota bacterium]MDP7436759.1 methionine adenosyltransferase [Candidatus Neomarinimicrobiota bacterium]|tara:strand:+ start:1750 stop:2931 length:1182 start_codon:yes stop_codon:yes gene_type:complete
MNTHLFTSESVTEGHPDKVCDAISDAILDNLLEQDSHSRVACETLATTGLIVVSGEVTTNGSLEVEHIVKDVLTDIGYVDEALGMDNEKVKVIASIHAQSSDISQGVDEGTGLHEEQGAGDQGLMFGFACTETPELMPLPIHLSHRLAERLAKLRKDGTMPWIRPDGKSQVTVEYNSTGPLSVTKAVIATQHDDMLAEKGSEDKEHEFIKSEVSAQIIKPVLEEFGIKYSGEFIVNGTGRFVFGGPAADTGLTGRKIIVDTYGGYAPHGGGAFSGKDPSKVDRSATYMARYIAKNVVAAELAEKCEIQFSYSIGVAEPTSFSIKTFGTGKLGDDELTKVTRDLFPLKPAAIIAHLDLKKPRYRQTSAYGHFGREGENFTWEKTDMVDDLHNLI